MVSVMDIGKNITPNDKIRYKGEYINDNRNGYWEFYYSNGQLMNNRYYAK